MASAESIFLIYNDLYYWLIQQIDVTKTRLISLMTPVIAVALGMLALGERLTWRIAMGTLLILMGVSTIVGEQFMAKYLRAWAPSQSSG